MKHFVSLVLLIITIESFSIAPHHKSGSFILTSEVDTIPQKPAIDTMTYLIFNKKVSKKVFDSVIDAAYKKTILEYERELILEYEKEQILKKNRN